MLRWCALISCHVLYPECVEVFLLPIENGFVAFHVMAADADKILTGLQRTFQEDVQWNVSEGITVKVSRHKTNSTQHYTFG